MMCPFVVSKSAHHARLRGDTGPGGGTFKCCLHREAARSGAAGSLRPKRAALNVQARTGVLPTSESALLLVMRQNTKERAERTTPRRRHRRGRNATVSSPSSVMPNARATPRAAAPSRVHATSVFAIMIFSVTCSSALSGHALGLASSAVKALRWTPA
jgi:hypothetical protein